MIPPTYQPNELSSKGFYDTVTIQDFPIRERAVLRHVCRRRWIVNSTGEIISRDWNTVENGTRYTKGFASFLKELFGQLPNQQ